MERIKWTPFAFCFAESLRRIKHFQDFKTANFRSWIESVKHPSINTIKWKEYQTDPIRVLLSQSLFGEFKLTLCTCVSKRTLRFNFERQMRFLKFAKKLMNLQKNTPRCAKKKEDFWKLIFKQSRTWGISKIVFPPPSTSHHTLKPIRMLITTFFYTFE